MSTYSPRLIAAVAALLAVCVPGTLVAQRQSELQQTEGPRSRVEVAALVLPEAPDPQAVPSPTAPPPASDPVPAAPPANGLPSTSVPANAAPPPSLNTPATPALTAAEAKKQAHDQAERDLQIQEKQRLLGVMPQFQVVMGGTAVPLSAGEKWRLALHSAIDPFYIGWAFVIGGGYGELVDSNSGYHWGAPGYFKRVGANYADNVNGALIGNALLPAVLHQDPRYFRKGTGSIKSRFVYAALSTVVCHGDNGKNQPNVSNVLGNFISGGISNAYYPADERGIALTLENGASVTLFGALGGQLLEFGPDLSHLIHRKRDRALAAAGAPQSAASAPSYSAGPPAAPASSLPNASASSPRP